MLCQEPHELGSLPADLLKVQALLGGHLKMGIKVENYQRALPFLECATVK